MLVTLRWWFIFCVSCLLGGLAGGFGWLTWLWSADVSRLSFLALGIYFLTTCFIGHLTYLAHDGKVKEAAGHTPVCWFASEVLLGIGLCGTLIGMLLVFSYGFSSFDPNDTAAAQRALGEIANGLKTSGLSTLIGIICSFVIKGQLVNLDYLLVDGKQQQV